MSEIISYLNIVVSIIAAVYGIKLAAMAKGGEMEKSWNLITVSAVVFAILTEITVITKIIDVGVSVFFIDLLSEIVKFVFIIIFTYALYSTRRNLIKRLFNK